MQLTAILRRTSPNYPVWIADGTDMALYRGIVFERRGYDFICAEDPLKPATLSRLQDDPNIQLEISRTIASPEG